MTESAFARWYARPGRGVAKWGHALDKSKGSFMTIKLEQLGKAVLATQYAVRGPIVARAGELERGGQEIIYCNIGNPQALEQKPLTYLRQVLALTQYPELIAQGAGLFPADVLETAARLLKGSRHGMGA